MTETRYQRIGREQRERREAREKAARKQTRRPRKVIPRDTPRDPLDERDNLGESHD